MSIIVRLASVIAAGFASLSLYAQGEVWAESPAGLPYCRYDTPKDDCVFLHGNYRMNLVTHANGIYEILSGERVWARFNADPSRPDYGKNRATVISGNKEIELVGSESKVQKSKYEVYNGIGFTRYDYRLSGGLRCTRTLSVMPSDAVNGGDPCFVITVTLSNTGGGTKVITYEEAFSPNFVPVADQMIAAEDRAFRYPKYTDVSFNCLKSSFAPTPQRFMQWPSPEARFRHEIAPQSVFLYADGAFLVISKEEFKATFYDLRLKSGEKKVLNIVIGFADGEGMRVMSENVLSKVGDGQFGAFEALWRKTLPDFWEERNRTIRREMFMSSYSLEASAVYSSFFEDTFIPGEGSDVFQTGENLSNRDHLQRALPACYTNQELAKSVLRYVMKHMDSDGRIYGGNMGYGYVPHSYAMCYDMQIQLFHVLSEYLRITEDYEFLDERMYIYPGEGGDYLTVMQIVERCFVFLRDEVVNEADRTAMLKNMDMVSSEFPSFVEQLKVSGRASDAFVKALEEYTDAAWDTFRKSEGYIEDEEELNEKSMSLYNYFRARE